MEKENKNFNIVEFSYKQKLILECAGLNILITGKAIPEKDFEKVCNTPMRELNHAPMLIALRYRARFSNYVDN